MKTATKNSHPRANVLRSAIKILERERQPLLKAVNEPGAILAFDANQVANRHKLCGLNIALWDLKNAAAGREQEDTTSPQQANRPQVTAIGANNDSKSELIRIAAQFQTCTPDSSYTCS